MWYNARMVCTKTMTKHEKGITKKEGKMSKDRGEDSENRIWWVNMGKKRLKRWKERSWGKSYEHNESDCYETRRGPRAYQGAGCSVRTWLQLMCCATRHLLSSNFGNGWRFGRWVWGTINVNFRLGNIHEVWNVFILGEGISGQWGSGMYQGRGSGFGK